MRIVCDVGGINLRSDAVTFAFPTQLHSGQYKSFDAYLQ